MKKITILCVATLTILAIASCIRWEKVKLSNQPFCKAQIVKAEIQFRIDSCIGSVTICKGWTEPEPYDFQPLVDYLCHCSVLQEPMKFAPSIWVRLYDINNNKYSLGLSTGSGALKKEGLTYRLSEEDACEIKKLLKRSQQ